MIDEGCEGSMHEEAWIDKATLRQINLDLDRTYTELGLFGESGPYKQALRDLLVAYATYRPSVGYVQGMAYIASTFLVYMEPEQVFVCMGNLLHNHHFPDFLLVDMHAIDLYAAAFTHVFRKELPALHRHLCTLGTHFTCFTGTTVQILTQKALLGVDCRLYLVEWWMTVFSTVLPLSASSLVWDLLLLEGIAAIVRITIGVLAVLQHDLLGASLETCLTVLTHAEDWLGLDVRAYDSTTPAPAPATPALGRSQECGGEQLDGGEQQEGGVSRSGGVPPLAPGEEQARGEHQPPPTAQQHQQQNEGQGLGSEERRGGRESKSFAAVLEAAGMVQVTRDSFMSLVHQSALSPQVGLEDHKATCQSP
jgi:hypothetical protein